MKLKHSGEFKDCNELIELDELSYYIRPDNYSHCSADHESFSYSKSEKLRQMRDLMKSDLTGYSLWCHHCTFLVPKDRVEFFKQRKNMHKLWDIKENLEMTEEKDYEIGKLENCYESSTLKLNGEVIFQFEHGNDFDWSTE